MSRPADPVQGIVILALMLVCESDVVHRDHILLILVEGGHAACQAFLVMTAGELDDRQIEPAGDVVGLEVHQPFQASQSGAGFPGVHQQVGQLQQEPGLVGRKLQLGAKLAAGFAKVIAGEGKTSQAHVRAGESRVHPQHGREDGGGFIAPAGHQQQPAVMVIGGRLFGGQFNGPAKLFAGLIQVSHFDQ